MVNHILSVLLVQVHQKIWYPNDSYWYTGSILWLTNLSLSLYDHCPAIIAVVALLAHRIQGDSTSQQSGSTSQLLLRMGQQPLTYFPASCMHVGQNCGKFMYKNPACATNFHSHENRNWKTGCCFLFFFISKETEMLLGCVAHTPGAFLKIKSTKLIWILVIRLSKIKTIYWCWGSQTASKTNNRTLLSSWLEWKINDFGLLKLQKFSGQFLTIEMLIGHIATVWNTCIMFVEAKWQVFT